MPIAGIAAIKTNGEGEAIPREPLEAEPSDICCAATTRLFLSAASRGVVGDDGVVEGVAALSVVDETAVGEGGGGAGVTGAPRRATSSLVSPATPPAAPLYKFSLSPESPPLLSQALSLFLSLSLFLRADASGRAVGAKGWWSGTRERETQRGVVAHSRRRDATAVCSI